MNEGINLLETHKKKTTIVSIKKLGVMRIFAGGLLFVVSVCSLILFILVALSPLPALQRQEQSLRTTLSQSKTEIAKIILLDDRATAITQLLKKRQSLDETISRLEGHMTDGIEVVSIRADHDTMAITLESNSLMPLQIFINGMMADMHAHKGFSKITMTDLSRDRVKGAYFVTLNLVLL